MIRSLLIRCLKIIRPCGECDALIRSLMTLQVALIVACVVLAVMASADLPGEGTLINAYRIAQLEKAVADLQNDRSKIIYLLVANLAGVVVTLFIYIARGRRGE